MSKAEWACLEAIWKAEDSQIPAERAEVVAGGACKRQVLHRLISDGLVELVVVMWLPLEMKQSVYRLTPAGKTLLRRTEDR